MQAPNKLDTALEQIVRVDRDTSYQRYDTAIGGFAGGMAGLAIASEMLSDEPTTLDTLECYVEGVSADQQTISVADMDCSPEYVRHDASPAEILGGVFVGATVGSLLVWNGIKWAAASRLGRDRYRELRGK